MAKGDTKRTSPRFPEVEVPLIGEDGNAFAIMGRVARALKGAGCDKPTILEFRCEAMAGDYNHLLTTVMDWVSIGGGEDE